LQLHALTNVGRNDYLAAFAEGDHVHSIMLIFRSIHTIHTIHTLSICQVKAFTIVADDNTMNRNMTSLATRRRLASIGEIVLLSYVLLVVVIAVLRVVTGFPFVADLTSSPLLLAHGEWWRLFTSALVIQGPPIPQVIAIAVLGTFGIYFGGSWTFWSTALAGHVFGTLLAYAGFLAAWMGDHTLYAHFLTDPDYGVSLVWCAALGAFGVLAWLGHRSDWRKPAHPFAAVAAVAAMVVVTIYSDDMAAVQHVIAFLIGATIIATADRSKTLYRDRRSVRLPRVAPRARRLMRP
jgi:membrane associated rhomboid family serine protease